MMRTDFCENQTEPKVSILRLCVASREALRIGKKNSHQKAWYGEHHLRHRYRADSSEGYFSYTKTLVCSYAATVSR
jgi:hypothetical protein